MAVGLFDFFLIETTLKSVWRAIREHLRYLSRNLSYFIFSCQEKNYASGKMAGTGSGHDLFR